MAHFKYLPILTAFLLPLIPTSLLAQSSTPLSGEFVCYQPSGTQDGSVYYLDANGAELFDEPMLVKAIKKSKRRARKLRTKIQEAKSKQGARLARERFRVEKFYGKSLTIALSQFKSCTSGTLSVAPVTDDVACSVAGNLDAHSGNRIIYGTECSAVQTSPVVKVLRDEQNNYSLCSGSLISDRWVITIGHCFNEATPGQNDPNGTKVVVAGQMISAKQIIVGPASIPDDKAENVPTIFYRPALIELSEAVGSVPPVILGAVSELAVGEPIIMAGWGGTDYIENYVISPFTDTPLSAGTAAITEVTSSHITTSRASGSTQVSTCFGDGGGPIFALRNQMWVQVGISDYGTNDLCGFGSRSDTASALRLRDSIEWIKQHVSGVSILE